MQSYNTHRRRLDTAVLLVTQNAALANRLKQSLLNLGYARVGVAGSHAQGLERIKEERLSLIFFDAVPSNMSGIEFVNAAKALGELAHMICLSAEPSIDQVFEILRAGARWFLVLPFNVESLEDVIEKAIAGPPFSDGILEALDRNAALVAVVLNALEELASTLEHARNYPASPVSLDSGRTAFVESIRLARTFAQGGDQPLLEKIIDGCILRATNPATRIGRVRKRLQKMREKEASRKTVTFKVPGSRAA